MFRRAILLALLGIVLLAISFMKWREHTQALSPSAGNLPVARVYDRYLYKRDLENITADITNPEDSARLAEQYIQSWMTKQLMIAEAEAHGEYNKTDIERRVLDYRYALLVHNYIEKLVNAQLDREVAEQDIAAYYQANQEQFVLRYNIFKGKFIVIPKNAPNSARLETLLTAKGERSLAALKSYCFQFAKDYSLDETAWLQWDELIKSTPFNNRKNKAKLLIKNKLLQTSDKEHLYYFKVDEYRRVNDIAPLEFVSDQIAGIIIYKRKIDLANKIKEEILQKAQKNNSCVIYDH